MTKEEAAIRLDEHDRYCEPCRLSSVEANQGRCVRGEALSKLSEGAKIRVGDGDFH